MEKAIEDNLTGLYNLVNNTTISKYDLLKLFNKELRDNQIQINEENELIIDKTLINTRTDFDFIIPSYENMVLEMKEWIDTHPNFYNHYKL
jgi:dTDP-4-dehydrorhamnose reductase